MGANESLYYPEPSPDRRPPRQRGCLFYGCLFTSILALAVAVAVAIGMIFLYRFANRAIEEYTDPAPMALPAPKLSEPESKAVAERLKEFRKSLDEGHAATLTLKSDELDSAINSIPEMAGKIHAEIVDDMLKGLVSIPFNIPGIGQRYLNGEAILKVSLEDGHAVVNLDQLVVKGNPVPERVMVKLREENLAREAMKNEKNSRILRRLESFKVHDGQITIISREMPKETRPEDADQHDDEKASKEGWPDDPFARETAPVPVIPTSAP